MTASFPYSPWTDSSSRTWHPTYYYSSWACFEWQLPNPTKAVSWLILGVTSVRLRQFWHWNKCFSIILTNHFCSPSSYPTACTQSSFVSQATATDSSNCPESPNAPSLTLCTQNTCPTSSGTFSSCMPPSLHMTETCHVKSVLNSFSPATSLLKWSQILRLLRYFSCQKSWGNQMSTFCYFSVQLTDKYWIPNLSQRLGMILETVLITWVTLLLMMNSMSLIKKMVL